MDTSAVICVCSGICGCKCLWNQAVEKTLRLFGPFVSAQKKQIHRVTCSKWKIIQEQHFLVSSLIKFPLFPVAVHVCVFETWWIHTAIHPARQCFHYFTTSLIPSSWSFSVRMDGKHPVKLPHTFTSTQLIVTAHHTNAQREKEDEIKTANFGKEIRVRKKGRMEMAKEKRKKKYCDWVELCSWLIFWVHKERKWCAVEWEGWQHFMLLQKMTSFLQTDSIASHIPRQRHFFSMYCYCQTDVTKSGHSPFVREKRDINWVLFWYKV